MHQVPLRRTDISRLTQIQCYKIYESVKKKVQLYFNARRSFTCTVEGARRGWWLKNTAG